MKQYVLNPAYSGNTHVTMIVDGKIMDASIVANYEFPGFLAALKNMGYEKGYFVPQYAAKMREAEKALKDAQEEYDEALNHPIHFAEGEEERYKKIVHLAE